MDITQKTVISLIKSALYNIKTVIPEGFDWEEFGNLVIRQNVSGLIYFGLYNSGCEIPEWLTNVFKNRMVRLEQLWYKVDEILTAFDKESIEYIPLKGIELKNHYPSPYMRQMSDADILIREKDYRKKIKPIMLSLGYSEGVESNHELHWIKEKQVIELHKRIIPSYNKDFYKIIGDGWDWVQQNPYAYVFTHFAKHYRDSGIGIKHIVDLEVIRNQATDKGLAELHLTKFYENVQRTLDCWFRDGEFDDVTTRITDTVFNGGEYGTRENSIKSQNLKKLKNADGNLKKARAKDFIYRLFPPYSVMKTNNPILRKLPILLPFMWIWRIIRSLFQGKVKKAYIENKNISENSDYMEELNAVGLDYWF